MKVHRLGVAPRQDQAGGFAFCRADGAEDVCRGGTLVARCGGPGSALRPTPGDLVFLADTGLIANQISMSLGPTPLLRVISSRTAGKLFKLSIAFAACA